MRKRTVLVIRLDAGHDVSGNPRRAYVGFDANANGNLVGAWDDVYAGWNAVPARLRAKAARAVTLATTPGEYRATLKLAPTLPLSRDVRGKGSR